LQGSTQGLKLTGLVINRDNVQVQANLKGNAGLVISNIP
jgi:acylphosphatase